MTIATVLAATFSISVSAQEFLAGSGTPGSAFPNPDRPVADIVSPIWRGEKERDAAGEAQQLVRLLGIKSGMTVADIGAGSGYYVVRLSLIVGSHGRIIAEDVVFKYLRGLRRRVRDLGLKNVVISLASRTIQGCQPIRSTLQFWCTCITKSPNPTACSTISFPRLSLARVLAFRRLRADVQAWHAARSSTL